MAREFLRITPETTPGVFATGGAHTIINIDQANAYTVRPKPITVDIRTAGAFNRRFKRVSKKTSLEGNLNLLLHGSLAAPFVNWAVAAANVLTSYTVDYCVTQEDSGSTIVYSRDLGVYVAQAQLSGSEADQVLRANLSLVGMSRSVITITDFPTPAITDYPSDAILTFEDGSAGLTLHAATRLDFETFNLTIKNNLDVRYFVNATPIKIRYCGRDVDVTSRLCFSASTPRADFNAQTAIPVAITFGNGTHSLVIGMNSQNFYDSVNDQIDHGKTFLNEVTLSSFVDTAIGDEVTISAT